MGYVPMYNNQGIIRGLANDVIDIAINAKRKADTIVQNHQLAAKVLVLYLASRGIRV